MSPRELRLRRVAERIPLHAVSARTGIGRGRLSEIETGSAAPRPGEIDRIGQALDELIEARRKVVTYAAEVGWPIAAA
jgi:transcriptional regulator with XRE-family HTH domain